MCVALSAAHNKFLRLFPERVLFCAQCSQSTLPRNQPPIILIFGLEQTMSTDFPLTPLGALVGMLPLLNIFNHQRKWESIVIEFIDGLGWTGLEAMIGSPS